MGLTKQWSKIGAEKSLTLWSMFTSKVQSDLKVIVVDDSAKKLSFFEWMNKKGRQSDELSRSKRAQELYLCGLTKKNKRILLLVRRPKIWLGGQRFKKTEEEELKTGIFDPNLLMTDRNLKTWGVTMEISHIKRSKQKRAGAGGCERRSCSSTPIFWRIGLMFPMVQAMAASRPAQKWDVWSFDHRIPRRLKQTVLLVLLYYWLKVQNHNRWFRPICLPSLFWRELGTLLRCNGTFCVEQHTQPLFFILKCMLRYVWNVGIVHSIALVFWIVETPNMHA